MAFKHVNTTLGREPPADPARARVIADLALGDGDADAVAASFSGARHCPAPLDAGERRLADGLAGRPLDHPDMPAWVRAECPEWLFPGLEALWGDGAEAELAALNRPAPVDLRVDTRKADREAARAALADDGIEAEPTALSPVGLRVAARVRIGGARAFRDGLVEVHGVDEQRPTPELAALWAEYGESGRDVPFALIREGVFENLRLVARQGLPPWMVGD